APSRGAAPARGALPLAALRVGYSARLTLGMWCAMGNLTNEDAVYAKAMVGFPEVSQRPRRGSWKLWPRKMAGRHHILNTVKLPPHSARPCCAMVKPISFKVAIL